MKDSTICLVGNPNVGKTTFFNMITDSFEHTGNYHGVTVDKKEKTIVREGRVLSFVDLPGIYSLSSYSFEEQVSIDYLLQNNPSVINVCDGNILHRNLYLTLQLLEAGIIPVLLVNFAVEVTKSGIKYDYNQLSQILGIKVVINKYSSKTKAQEDIFSMPFFGGKATPLPYIKDLPIDEVLSVLSQNQKSLFCGKETFLAIKMLEQDQNIIDKLSLSPNQQKQLSLICSQKDYMSYIATLRYNYIDSIMSKIKTKKREFVYGKFFIDQIILNKYLCLPILFAVIFLIFYITFSSFGAFLSECLKSCIDRFVGVPITSFLLKINAPAWIIGLFSSGIISGVGGLVSFIPQVVLLFFFLSVLEDSGYISRLSFCFEDIFYKFGLSGKSIFTLLMSFGCTTSSILTARTIEDKNTKIKTVLASPYMSCSAKLPIYAVIGGAFFGRGNMLVIVLMYLVGIIVSLFVSSLLSRRALVSGERSFILELPPYRMPSFGRVTTIIVQNCKSFIVKVSTILLSFSVIVWILQNFSFRFEYLPQTAGTKSMLQIIGEALCPLFAPIGLNNWGIVVSLLVGVMAKEMIVGTMAIINKVPTSSDFNAQLGQTFMLGSFVIGFSKTTALIMMLFSLLYMPCISSMAVMKKEIGLKWTLLGVLLQFSIAYALCFVLFSILSGNILARFLTIIVLLLCFILYLLKSYNSTGHCGKCTLCAKKCP